MKGGFVPGGMPRSTACEMAVTWPSASSMLTPGWKKTLTTAIPRSDCDSMCSMSLTFVVSERS